LRRITIIGTALAVLAGATAAVAASQFNTYTATAKLSPSKAGSKASPSPLRWTEDYTASGNGGNRTSPLTDVKWKIYGLVSDGKDFPTCTLNQIAAAKSDAGCPPGAMVGNGAITAVVGPTADPSTGAANTFECDPILHEWNGGQGKVVLFFVDQAPNHSCGPLTTGAVGPYQATAKQQGKFFVLDTPVPRYVSFPVTGLEGSIKTLHMDHMKLTKKVKGHTHAYLASTACKAGKRPWSVSFTAENASGQMQTSALTGSSKC
jgi:hypothetical protein